MVDAVRGTVLCVEIPLVMVVDANVHVIVKAIILNLNYPIIMEKDMVIPYVHRIDAHVG